MRLKPEHYDTILDILESIDYERIKSVMDHLNWGWSSGDAFKVPDQYEIRKSARKLLVECAESTLSSETGEYIIGTGGFRAEGKLYEDGFLWLRLAFLIEEYDNCE
jgi:hypothetical protein